LLEGDNLTHLGGDFAENVTVVLVAATYSAKKKSRSAAGPAIRLEYEKANQAVKETSMPPPEHGDFIYGK